MSFCLHARLGTRKPSSLKSLRVQILVGVIVIVVLLIAIGLIGYIGTKSLAMSTRSMRNFADLNAGILEVDRDVQELQMWAEKYITTGHDSIRDSAVKVHDKLVSRVQGTMNGSATQEIKPSLQEISRHLDGYRTHFDSVVQERQLREQLTVELLPAQSRLIGDALTELQNAPDIPKETAEALVECQMLFNQSEQLLIRYYESPDTAVLNLAFERLNPAISRMSAFRTAGAVSQPIKKLVQELKEYKRITLRAVQATRGYLYLVNVVMAGEASEVTYYSDRLRTLAEARRLSISESVASAMDRNESLTVYSIIAAVMLASLMAARLGLLILPPISSLTRTFQRLAAGETLVDIPEAQRSDEIGDMARAARVFSDQNLMTRELLAESEKLGQQLKQNTEELIASNEELDSFAYVASHDLKSPLRGIRQLSTWIAEDSGHLLPEESLEHLSKLKERVTKMETLLQDLLDFSRVGRQDRECEVVNLSTLITGALDLTDNPGDVAVNYSQQLPTFATLRQPLEQVLLNLIGNAIKHNNKGAEGTVDVSVVEDEGWYRFRVEDNGPGIDKTNHERVFQLYQRVGDSTVDGSGMGLAIVKKQIEGLGGNISLDSSLGAGSVFEFTWPVEFVPAGNQSHE